MNLSGEWKGKYTYGWRYGLRRAGRSEEFKLTIRDEGGSFTGTCMDPIVASIVGNESTIEGLFGNNRIHFTKTYKFSKGPRADVLARYEIKAGAFQYAGVWTKGLFSRQPYFKGRWTLPVTFVNRATGEVLVRTGGGSWRMQKA